LGRGVFDSPPYADLQEGFTVIGLVDCNNFYCSCERVFQPWFNGKAVGVLSNNDGCVIARSQELKALGVEMGTPAFKIKDLIKAKKVYLFSSNYELYGDMSNRVQSILEEFSAGIEPYSIDECFVRFEGFEREQLIEHCHDLRRKVKKFTGIPVCVGVAPTRTLSKLANRIAKKVARFEGVFVIEKKDCRLEKILERVDIGDVWGIGRKLVGRLNAMGIYTALDLSRTDPREMKKAFSVVLERTILELQGKPCITMNDYNEPKKRIMTSRSFGRLTDDFEQIQQAIRQHAQRGAEKLREQNSLCRAVLVFLQTNRHREDLAQYSPSFVIELENPTDDSRKIISGAGRCLREIFREGYQFMKGGVMLIDLIDSDKSQMSLLDDSESVEKREKADKLMSVIDQVNKRMGRQSVRFGLPSANASWHLRCSNRSNRYSTRWDELPKAQT
jgi:DNA polymerase V